jgi:hypothetical protein
MTRQPMVVKVGYLHLNQKFYYLVHWRILSCWTRRFVSLLQSYWRFGGSCLPISFHFLPRGCNRQVSPNGPWLSTRARDIKYQFREQLKCRFCSFRQRRTDHVGIVDVRHVCLWPAPDLCSVDVWLMCYSRTAHLSGWSANVGQVSSLVSWGCWFCFVKLRQWGDVRNLEVCLSARGLPDTRFISSLNFVLSDKVVPVSRLCYRQIALSVTGMRSLQQAWDERLEQNKGICAQGSSSGVYWHREGYP